MSNRLLHTFASASALALGLALSACAAEQPPEPVAARTPSLDSVSFSDGATLPAGTDVSWGDGFAHDDGWEEVARMAAPGRWMYENADRTCVAAFRGGALGDAGDMNDLEATDAVIAAELGEDPVELAQSVSDGYFLRYGPGDAQVAHHQFSFTVNGVGRFIAARAFVELNYSVQVMIMCEGVDLSVAAEEVLSKNMISIEAPSQP
ncbi:hypothetical protein [Microbacterium abyssi]|uniref:hypothetical protein n=1 Tax=Microbacterium abyssi TaxID=2782166 RepID=UPI00188743EE|nr:hypothetical protein [Microbacterium sp. A18JL241]